MSKEDPVPNCYRAGCDLAPQAGGLCLEHALDDALDMLKEGSELMITARSEVKMQLSEEMFKWVSRALRMIGARKVRQFI